jgi:predicted nucleic acid-binding Zn ribbon protein
MQENLKQCLHCTKKITGRTDKKFCSNHCRSSYHNILYGDRSNYMRRVNGLLMRNRKILSDLFELNRAGATIPLSELYLKGFSTSHFTHQQKKSRSLLLTYCYDYGYHFTGKDTIKIVQQFNSE